MGERCFRRTRFSITFRKREHDPWCKPARGSTQLLDFLGRLTTTGFFPQPESSSHPENWPGRDAAHPAGHYASLLELLERRQDGTETDTLEPQRLFDKLWTKKLRAFYAPGGGGIPPNLMAQMMKGWVLSKVDIEQAVKEKMDIEKRQRAEADTARGLKSSGLEAAVIELVKGESANKKCRNEELKAACKRRGCTRTELGALARKVQFMQKLISLLSSSAATRQALDARAIELRPVAVKGKKRKIAPQGKHKGKRSNKGKVRAMVSSSEDSNSEEDDSDAESDQEEEFVQEPAAEAFANREPNAFATFGDAYAVSWQATEAFAKSKGLTLVEFDATRTSAELATDKLFPGGKVGKMCGAEVVERSCLLLSEFREFAAAHKADNAAARANSQKTAEAAPVVALGRAQQRVALAGEGVSRTASALQARKQELYDEAVAIFEAKRSAGGRKVTPKQLDDAWNEAEQAARVALEVSAEPKRTRSSTRTKAVRVGDAWFDLG
jgi:hypothetical protein